MLSSLYQSIFAFYLSLVPGLEAPESNDVWTVEQRWEQIGDNYYFTATSSQIPELCRQNPAYSVDFPTLEFASSILYADHTQVTQVGDFKKGLIGGMGVKKFLSCSLFIETKEITWNLQASSKIFSQISHLPKLTKSVSFLERFFNASSSIAGGILFILSIFIGLIFWKSISPRLVLPICISSFHGSIFYLLLGLNVFEISMNPLLHQKVSGTALFISHIFLMIFFNHIFKINKIYFMTSCFIQMIGTLIIVTASNVEDSQFGSTLFLIALSCDFTFLWMLFLKQFLSNLNSKYFFILCLATFCLILFANDIFIVTGLVQAPMTSSLGFVLFFLICSIYFQKEVEQIHSERADYKHKLEQSYQERLKIIAENSVAHSVMNTVQMICHDLKQPFAMLKAVLGQMNKLDLKPSDMSGLMQRIEKNTDYVNHLLLDMMQIGSERVNRLEPVDFAELAKESWAQIEKPHSFKGEFRFSTQDAQTLFVDKLKVKRLFANLFQNALAHGSKDQNIWLEIRHTTLYSRPYLEISLGNHGPPLSAEKCKSIFSKFETSKDSGTGLGLVISAEIVRSHGGEIFCRSLQDKGNEFVFTLPLVRS